MRQPERPGGISGRHWFIDRTDRRGQKRNRRAERKPERYGALMPVVLRPHAGIYGFVVGLFVMIKLGMFGGTGVAAVTWYQGLQILAACLPVAIAGWTSGILQGKTGAAGILMAAKRPELAFKAGVVFAAMVELYAILGFLTSLLIILMGINLG